MEFVFLTLALLGIYFAPTLIASFRGLANAWPIMVINFCFGWTLLGWVLVLCWASSGTAAKLQKPTAAPAPCQPEATKQPKGRGQCVDFVV
jgi:hypothetical protein